MRLPRYILRFCVFRRGILLFPPGGRSAIRSEAKTRKSSLVKSRNENIMEAGGVKYEVQSSSTSYLADGTGDGSVSDPASGEVFLREEAPKAEKQKFLEFHNAKIGTFRFDVENVESSEFLTHVLGCVVNINVISRRWSYFAPDPPGTIGFIPVYGRGVIIE